jgi:hypothetical protein
VQPEVYDWPKKWNQSSTRFTSVVVSIDSKYLDFSVVGTEFIVVGTEFLGWLVYTRHAQIATRSRFCSTTTPNLGLSKHTYVKISRVADHLDCEFDASDDGSRFVSIYKCLGHSLTSIPISTASGGFHQENRCRQCLPDGFPAPFWTSTNSPHYQVVVDDKNKETANFDILTYKAPRTYDTSRECKDLDSDLDDFPVPVSVLTTRLLESLGWQKIRYDVREHLPTVYRRVRYPVLSSSNCWVASVIPARRFPWDIPCWWPIPRANSPST